MTIEVDQDVLDVLMDKATRYALIVSDGTPAAMEAILKEHGADMSLVARKRLAAHIIEHGPASTLDADLWARVLRELQPKVAT